MTSEKAWERGVALTSTLHWFEADLLARKKNLADLARLNRELGAQAEGVRSPHRVVLDRARFAISSPRLGCGMSLGTLSTFRGRAGRNDSWAVEPKDAHSDAGAFPWRAAGLDANDFGFASDLEFRVLTRSRRDIHLEVNTLFDLKDNRNPKVGALIAYVSCPAFDKEWVCRFSLAE